MKIKGKAAAWFWIIMLGGNVSYLVAMIMERDWSFMAVLGIFIFDIIFVPMAVRNYVVLEEEELVLAFGFFTDSIEYRDIIEVYETHNPISSTAASLDRIVIRGRRQEIVCAVKDKKRLYEELLKHNEGITMNVRKSRNDKA